MVAVSSIHYSIRASVARVWIKSFNSNSEVIIGKGMQKRCTAARRIFIRERHELKHRSRWSLLDRTRLEQTGSSQRGKLIHKLIASVSCAFRSSTYRASAGSDRSSCRRVFSAFWHSIYSRTACFWPRSPIRICSPVAARRSSTDVTRSCC